VSRAPLDVSGGRPTSPGELEIARQLVRRSGIARRLTPALEAEVGRPRELTLEGLLVALQLNALRRHHQAHLVEAARVLNALTDAQRNALGQERWDPGPEFIAYAVADWCRFNHTDTVFIDPGSLWQNAWIESFNGRLRDEHLNGQPFDSLLEAQVLTEDWRVDYNCNRPHSAHGWLTPVEFVEAWLHQQPLQLA